MSEPTVEYAKQITPAHNFESRHIFCSKKEETDGKETSKTTTTGKSEENSNGDHSSNTRAGTKANDHGRQTAVPALD